MSDIKCKSCLGSEFYLVINGGSSNTLKLLNNSKTYKTKANELREVQPGEMIRFIYNGQVWQEL